MGVYSRLLCLTHQKFPRPLQHRQISGILLYEVFVFHLGADEVSVQATDQLSS